MQLDGTLGGAILGPREQAQAKLNGSRIKAEQLVLETELLLLARALAAAEVPQMEEGILIKLPGTVGIGVRQGGAPGGIGQTKMFEFPETRDRWRSRAENPRGPTGRTSWRRIASSR